MSLVSLTPEEREAALNKAIDQAREEKEAELNARFDHYLETGAIELDTALVDGQHVRKYVIARATLDKLEAVTIAANIESAVQFDRIKQLCFVNGMVDGIQNYLAKIRSLNEPLKNEKAIKAGVTILDYIARERTKI